jgi:hypothetical protein
MINLLNECSLVSVDNASGVSSLQSVMSASQTSNRNLLTPSLAKFFRADLIAHVTNWPSEILEKQVSFIYLNMHASLFNAKNLLIAFLFRHKSAPKRFI